MMGGYCPECGFSVEHRLSKDKKHYICSHCKSKQEKEFLEDIWITVNYNR